MANWIPKFLGIAVLLWPGLSPAQPVAAEPQGSEPSVTSAETAPAVTPSEVEKPSAPTPVPAEVPPPAPKPASPAPTLQVKPFGFVILNAIYNSGTVNSLESPTLVSAGSTRPEPRNLASDGAFIMTPRQSRLE